jgi:hypothetical protein
MKRRVEDLTRAEQQELIDAIVAGYHSLAKLDTSGLRVVKESSLVEFISKRGFASEVVKEVIRDICVVEEGVVLGLKG